VPGKDSYEHRKAGASEVIVSSPRRWAQVHEIGDDTEATLAQLLRRVSPCDLVLVEGYKTHPFPKLEVYRPALGKPPIWPEQADIAAIAADAPVSADRTVLPLNDPAAIAAWIVAV